MTINYYIRNFKICLSDGGIFLMNHKGDFRSLTEQDIPYYGNMIPDGVGLSGGKLFFVVPSIL